MTPPPTPTHPVRLAMAKVLTALHEVDGELRALGESVLGPDPDGLLEVVARYVEIHAAELDRSCPECLALIQLVEQPHPSLAVVPDPEPEP